MRRLVFTAARMSVRPGLVEHQTGRGLCYVCGIRHRDSNFRLLQGRSVVHAVSGHSRDCSGSLQCLNYVKFVFRIHVCENVALEHLGCGLLSRAFGWMARLPMPTRLATARAVAKVSPVIMVTRTPSSCAGRFAEK